MVARRERLIEIDSETGDEVAKEVEILDRSIDDELPDVARSYLKWLEHQQ